MKKPATLTIGVLVISMIFLLMGIVEHWYSTNKGGKLW
jgi:hypothetical protein